MPQEPIDGDLEPEMPEDSAALSADDHDVASEGDGTDAFDDDLDEDPK